MSIITYVPSYTLAGLPASPAVGSLARVSDDIGGLWMYSGTAWEPVGGFTGTWVPYMNAVANVDSFDPAYVAHYIRSGSYVFCNLSFNIKPTLTTTLTKISIGLPFASEFTAAADVTGGVTSNSVTETGVVYVDVPNNLAEVQFVSVTAALHTINVHFSYKIN